VSLINLTPHAINLYDSEGEEVVSVLPVSGSIARAKEEIIKVEGLYTEEIVYPVVEKAYSAVENLPPPTPGKVYVVSIVVKAALPNRDDLYCPDTGPGSAVRDHQGRVLGVRRLQS